MAELHDDIEASPEAGLLNESAKGRVERYGAVALSWCWRPAASPGDPAYYVAPPDGVIDVVVASRRGALAIHVIGPTLGASSKPTQGIDFTLAARLRPGASSVLFGASARDLRDHVVPLGDCWSEAGPLLERLATSRGLAERESLLTQALDRRLSERLRTRDDLRAAERAIRAARSAWRTDVGRGMRVSALASRVGASERALRRVFDDALGISPRAYRAASRFRAALESVAQTQHDGARIAADAGYADQPHMSRDFRERMSATPSALRRLWADRAPLLRPGL